MLNLKNTTTSIDKLRLHKQDTPDKSGNDKEEISNAA